MPFNAPWVVDVPVALALAAVLAVPTLLYGLIIVVAVATGVRWG